MPEQKLGFLKRTLQALQNVYVVWMVVLIDAILLLWAMVVRPQVFQYTWAKVLMLVAAVKAVLVFLGIVENERLKNPYTDLHEFLLNPFAWSAILLFSALFWVGSIYLQVAPPALSVTLTATRGLHASPTLDRPSGYLKIHKDGERDIFSGHVSLDTTITVPYIELYTGYEILFISDDPRAYTSDSTSVLTVFGKTEKTLPISPTKHLVRFILTPLDARLQIDGVSCPGNLADLTKGRYTFTVSAIHHMTHTDTVDIPQGINEKFGTFAVELQPVMVHTTFFADRGIGKKRIPIDGKLTLREGASIIVDSLRTGMPVGIPVGRKFTATVVARGIWDLSSRRYRGDTSFVFNQSVQRKEFWVKVIEEF